MKSLDKINLNKLVLFLMAVTALFTAACKKNSTSGGKGAPEIIGVRNYAKAPGDTIVNAVNPGQWVVIRGKNLMDATSITFDGVGANFNAVWFSDTTAVVLLPAVIPFPSVNASQLNTIHYVTSHGETTFSFPVNPPAPTISGISNEAANPGDSVAINGLNFFFIKKVIYAGVEVTGYKASNTGTSIRFVVPANIKPGKVSVTTNSGVATTTYNVYDFQTGVACNWDDINTYPWGSGTSNSSTDFPGNTGTYDVIGATNYPPGGSDWYSYPHSINLYGVQWVPASDISATPDSYAVKFEMSVTAKTPWVNGTLALLANYNFSQMALYTPWAGSITPFVTNGWQTVTIPLSTFMYNGSVAGTPPTSITSLIGASGNNALEFMFFNYGKTTVTSAAIAIDNVRVVKIK